MDKFIIKVRRSFDLNPISLSPNQLHCTDQQRFTYHPTHVVVQAPKASPTAAAASQASPTAAVASAAPTVVSIDDDDDDDVVIIGSSKQQARKAPADFLQVEEDDDDDALQRVGDARRESLAVAPRLAPSKPAVSTSTSSKPVAASMPVIKQSSSMAPVDFFGSAPKAAPSAAKKSAAAPILNTTAAVSTEEIVLLDDDEIVHTIAPASLSASKPASSAKPSPAAASDSGAAASSQAAKRQRLENEPPRAQLFGGEFIQPKGRPGCLDKFTFVATGELEHFTRDQITALIKKYGGRLTGGGADSYPLINSSMGPPRGLCAISGAVSVAGGEAFSISFRSIFHGQFPYRRVYFWQNDAFAHGRKARRRTRREAGNVSAASSSSSSLCCYTSR